MKKESPIKRPIEFVLGSLNPWLYRASIRVARRRSANGILSPAPAALSVDRIEVEAWLDCDFVGHQEANAEVLHR